MEDPVYPRTLEGVLDELEGSLAELARIVARSDPERKLDLVRRRRVFAEQLASLNTIVAAHCPIFATGRLAPAFRERFSKVRHMVALHQATWSAVLIDGAEAEYELSASATSAAVRDFVSWMRVELRVLPAPR